MEVLTECINKLRSGDVSKLTSEQCLDLDVEYGAALCRTSSGLAVCLEKADAIMVRVSTASVKEQLPTSATPFNIKNNLKNAPLMYSLDTPLYTGVASTTGLNGGELVIQINKN